MESPAVPSDSAPSTPAFFEVPEFRQHLEELIEASGLAPDPAAASANVLQALREAATNDPSELWQSATAGAVVLALARAGGLALGVAEGVTTAVEPADVDETVTRVPAEEPVAAATNTAPLPERQGDDPVTRAMASARNEVSSGTRRGAASI